MRTVRPLGDDHVLTPSERGSLGGQARAEISDERLSEIGKIGAAARWQQPPIPLSEAAEMLLSLQARREDICAEIGRLNAQIAFAQSFAAALTEGEKK
jgi:hypothetical protein